jgi:hypothetical protein
MPHRDYTYLGTTRSLCPRCRVLSGIEHHADSGGLLAESDFYPLPCAHPNCHLLAYLYRGGSTVGRISNPSGMADGLEIRPTRSAPVPINRLIDVSQGVVPGRGSATASMAIPAYLFSYFIRISSRGTPAMASNPPDRITSASLLASRK